MRVATYYSNNDIRIEEKPRPKIGRGELLIRVEASGICGTDVIEWYHRGRTPLVLGHEIAGEIEEVGGDLWQYKKGQRVSASHHVPCQKCSYCLSGHQTVCQTLRKTNFDPGGFAEYLRLPAINIELGGVYPLPQQVSCEEATFIEPLACVLRGQRLARMSRDKSVLVMGCGVAGLLHVALARASGASYIAACDIVDYRLDFASRLGANKVINAQNEDVSKYFRLLNQNRGADLVIVATGAKEANMAALEAVEHGGTILFFAATDEGITIPLSVNDVFWRNETTLISSYAATPHEHLQALQLIQTGKIGVKELISQKLSLDRIQEGFRLVAEAGECLKVIIEPNR